jgi:hypothetical protein
MRAIVILAASLALAGCAAAGPAAPQNLTVVQIRQVCDAFEGLDQQRTIDEPSAMVVRYGRERGICSPGERHLVRVHQRVFMSVTASEAQLACDVAAWIDNDRVNISYLVAEPLRALARESADQGLCGSGHPVQWSAVETACQRIAGGAPASFEDTLLGLAGIASGRCDDWGQDYAAVEPWYGPSEYEAMLAGQACFTPAVPGGRTVCGPARLPPDDQVLATCQRVARAHADGRTVDQGSEQLARQGRQAGICG